MVKYLKNPKKIIILDLDTISLLDTLIKKSLDSLTVCWFTESSAL